MLLVWLVIVPTALLLLLGVFMLVYWRTQLNIIFGILVVTLVGCLVTGTVLSLVFLRKEAKLSKLQVDFVSKVSHELRTPLTSIKLFVDMLASHKESDPEKVALCIDVLQKETGRLSDRIERLLDWGRMEAGRRIYRLEPTDVSDIISAALSAFRTATVGLDVLVHIDIQPQLPRIHADREAMADALVNLLSNAYKYSNDDRTITVRAFLDTHALRLAVVDNGIGIPLAEHRRIFQKFYRVDERLSREVEGSGLGLAIVGHVVDAHGGSIEVDSEPGNGSTLTIVLPETTWVST